jgi:CO/xanthine dehydrogenase FAD-binding subunit
MLLPDFKYMRPKSFDQLLSHLIKYGNDASILAAGTDLIPRRPLAEKAYEDAIPGANMSLSPLYRKRMIRIFARELLRSTADRS